MRRVSFVFDLDGTLINSCHAFLEVINSSLAPFGIKVDNNFIENIRHKNPQNLFDEILSGDDLKVANKRLVKFSNEVALTFKPFPEILDLLEFLNSNNMTVSVWTGRDLNSAKLILENNDMINYFKKIVSGTCVRNNKPHPEGLNRILHELSLSPSELIMIGDHHHDISAARSTGALSVLANWHGGDPRNSHHQPDHCFGDVKSFMYWIQSNLF